MCPVRALAPANRATHAAHIAPLRCPPALTSGGGRPQRHHRSLGGGPPPFPHSRIMLQDDQLKHPTPNPLTYESGGTPTYIPSASPPHKGWQYCLTRTHADTCRECPINLFLEIACLVTFFPKVRSALRPPLQPPTWCPAMHPQSFQATLCPINLAVASPVAHPYHIACPALRSP